MTVFAISGSGGFLGWHTKSAIVSLKNTFREIKLGNTFDELETIELISGSDVYLHIAGVNRGTPDEVIEGNIQLARQAAAALSKCASPPNKIVFANSIQSLSRNDYGDSKKASSEILQNCANKLNIAFEDVILPNLYGEGGKPFYNSVTSTFCHLISRGQIPEVIENRTLSLMHAQDAADLLLGEIKSTEVESYSHQTTVENLLSNIIEISDIYSEGIFPDLTSSFNRNLFNTYRAYLTESKRIFKPNVHFDSRGTFVEITKSICGSSQTSISTTAPGIIRGQHFHRRKIERFTVISGIATIKIRRLFSNQILEYTVRGDEPMSIDMPTLWAHNISNTGDSVLTTAFWTNEIFDPNYPDTFTEDV